MFVAYPKNREVSAKKVKNFYLYYSTSWGNPIGISGIETIKLYWPDEYAPSDTTKASWFTTGKS